MSMEGYITIKEAAEKWNITARRVQMMCANGQIDGVTKFGRAWVVPADVEKPKDGRITTGEYKNWRKKSEDKN